MRLFPYPIAQEDAVEAMHGPCGEGYSPARWYAEVQALLIYGRYLCECPAAGGRKGRSL